MALAMITGAGSGIGQAIARSLDRKGWSCILAGRNEDKLNATKEQLENPSFLCPLDLSNENSIHKAVKSLFKEVLSNQPLDSLINNAGIYIKGTCQELSAEDNLKIFSTNLFGPMELTKLLIPSLEKSNNPTILNISSTLGLKPMPEAGAYSASKSAMNNWTQTLALELAPMGIRANAVCPGLVETPIHEFCGIANDDPLRDQLNQIQPIGRIGQPQDISELITFLSSPENAWMTGSIISIDGGVNIA